jgi:hypothetical protein
MGMKMMCDFDTTVSRCFGRDWLLAEVATHGFNLRAED